MHSNQTRTLNEKLGLLEPETGDLVMRGRSPYLLPRINSYISAEVDNGEKRSTANAGCKGGAHRRAMIWTTRKPDGTALLGRPSSRDFSYN